MNKISIIEVIQLMLAPGIMISACGLLILGINNKYSMVVNRIRLLNEERRRILGKLSDKSFNLEENVRIASISKQLLALGYRVKLVRNSVLSYTIADRKSTRLNSSHLGISYAVFCLKKKKKQHSHSIAPTISSRATALGTVNPTA